MLGPYLSTCTGVFYSEVVSDGNVVLDSVVVKSFELKRPAQHFFTDEENAEAQERLKKIEEEEAKKLVTVPEHKRHTGKRTVDYSNLDVVENVIDPQEVLDASEDYVLMGEETTDTLVTEPKKLCTFAGIDAASMPSKRHSSRLRMTERRWSSPLARSPWQFCRSLHSGGSRSAEVLLPHASLQSDTAIQGGRGHGEQFDYQRLAQPNVRSASSSVQCPATASDEVSVYTL